MPRAEPDDRLKRARRYRRRAEEIRAVADAAHQAATKLMLASLAVSYDHMAEVLETMHVPE